MTSTLALAPNSDKEKQIIIQVLQFCVGMTKSRRTTTTMAATASVIFFLLVRFPVRESIEPIGK